MPEPSFAEILARVRAAYASCRTYRDEGEAVKDFLPLHSGDRMLTHSTRKPFSTAFARPARLRFEYRSAFFEDGTEDEDWERYVILCDEHGARSRWTVQRGTHTYESVEEALGAAKGVSGGTSWTVPAMLIGATRWTSLPAAESVASCELVELEGVACFLLRSASREGDSQATWISCHDFLVRQIDEVELFDERRLAELPSVSGGRRERRELEGHARTFRTESRTRYAPVVDAALPPAAFDWDGGAPAPRPYESPLRSAKIVEFAADDARPSASELLSAARAAYASCATFRESGQWRSIEIRRGRPRPGFSYSYSLAFQRADRLRIEKVFGRARPSRTLWLWNEDGCRWGPLGAPAEPRACEVESVASFRHTHGSVGLLLARVALDPLPPLDTAVVVGTDVLDGVECYVLRGVPPGRESATLWIARGDSLLRRIESRFVFDDAHRKKVVAEIEAALREADGEEEREAMKLAIERLSHRAGHVSQWVLELRPEPDVELAPDAFATPESWRAT